METISIYLANSSSSPEVTLKLFNTKVSFLDEAKSGNKKCNLIQTPTILVTNYQNSSDESEPSWLKP